MLVAELHFQQVFTELEGHAQGVALGLVGGGGHFVQLRAIAGLAGAGAFLEVVASAVVVGLAVAAVVTDVEELFGVGGGEVAAAGRVVAAVEGAHFALVDARRAWCGKFWRCAVGDDGAADAVTADADRSDAGVHLQIAQVARGDIRHCRVHMVGAGGHQVHAIDLDAQAIVGQAVDRRQAGDAARAVQAHAGHAAQQAGAVAGGRAQVVQLLGADPDGAGQAVFQGVGLD